MTRPARIAMTDPLQPAVPTTAAAARRRPLRRRQQGRIGRIAMWGLAAVVALAGLLLAGITWGPNMMRDRLAAFVGETIGREIRVGRIDVAPFAGRITISEVSIAGLEGTPPMMTARTVTIEADPLASLRGVIVVRGVALEAPSVRAVRTGPARFDFSNVVERFANRPESRRKTDWQIDHVAITDGTVTLDDRVVRKVSTVGALRLALSGLTNRDEHADRPATLDAAFTLNGHPVAVDGSATPFAQPRAGSLHATLRALPMSDLLPYLPLPADVRPTAGTLDLDLRAAWAETSEPGGPLKLEGRVGLKALRVEDAGGQERIGARTVVLTLAPSWPLGGTVHVAELAIEAPALLLGRGADGSQEWPAARAATAGGAPVAATNAAAAPGTRPARVGPKALRIGTITVDGGRVAWRDAGLAAPLDLRIEPLKVAARDIAIADLAHPARLQGQARIDATLDGHAVLGADVALAGASGQARVELGRLELPRYAALAGPALKATIEQGLFDARADVRWEAADARWSIVDASAELSDLRIAHDGRTPASLQKASVSGLAVDGAARRIEVGALKVEGASLAARRGPDGRVDLQDWYVPQATPARDAGSGAVPAPAQQQPPAALQAAAPAASPGGATPWTATLQQVELSRLDIDYSDALIARDRKLPRLTLSGKASNVTLDARQAVPFEAVAALADGSRLTARGNLRPAPLDLDATLRLQRFTLTHFDPYLAPFVNLTLASGQLWSSGRLKLVAGDTAPLARIGFDGEISVNEFRATDKVTSDDFLRWTALALPSVKVDWRTGRPGDSLIEIGAVAFVDFYSRIILSPEGRLNLADIVIDPDRPVAPRSLTAAPEVGVPLGTVTAAAVPGGSAGTPTRPPTPAAAAAPAGEGASEGTPAGRAGLAGADRSASGRRVATVGQSRPTPGDRPTIRVGTVRIASGNVSFTDLFIRPNYSANLTQLTGSIDAVASDRDAPSDVLVTGRVDDDTPLEITGKINPLTPRSYIDLRAVARGFDLPKLSAYSGRWAGYAIEKGKLTADVRYRIEGDRLEAENKLTINQLTFGDKIESPDATSLPVRLAVSLLKDRNGNIDLDLPISGTITDPQFSVGGLIWRAIGNLIVKVVTSPFTALASLAGGSSAAEMSHVDFAAGSAALDDDSRGRLEALARAMTERPGLSLDIAGYADPAADRDAMQRERLDTTLRSAKLAQMKRADPGAELPPLREVPVEGADRPVLLELAWRDAKLDAGGAKVPSPEQIEQLLIERSPVATEEVKQIAQQRAQAARDFLRDQKGISNERLYLLAPRIAASGDTLPPRRANFEIK